MIEDEAPIAELIATILTRFGYGVTTACGGREGVDFFEKNYYDLVITDIRMPDIDGLAVARHIRGSSRPGTPIVSISGTPWLLKAAEFDMCLQKPFTLQALVETVERAMPGQEISANGLSA